MTNLRSFLTLTTLATVAGIGIAFAQGNAAGDYNLTVGHATPCHVSLASDGSANVDATCAHVSDVTHWQSTASGIQLVDNAGTIVAVLRTHGADYSGATFADNRSLLLAPTRDASAH